jgi:four helix bundle protein
MIHKFEKLVVWEKASDFLVSVYNLCKKLPYSEDKVLIDQLKRAALSIALNIAEGTGSETDVEFKRFLYISKKSQVECIAILKIINKIYSINVVQETEKAEEIGKMLQGLVKYLKR